MFVATTRARGIPAPVGSSTCPVILPLVPCPYSKPLHAASTIQIAFIGPRPRWSCISDFHGAVKGYVRLVVRDAAVREPQLLACVRLVGAFGRNFLVQVDPQPGPV